MILASGKPISFTALSVLAAKFSAFGFALPMSSLANIAMRLAMKSALSPESMSLAR